MLLYKPHENQIKIHQSQAKYRVVVAGRRFGKTALGLNEALYRALQLKNQIIWIILPHLKQAKEVYWIDPDVTRYFMPFVQQRLVAKNDSELSLHVLHTNSWIRLKGADNYESLRGSGLDLIIWDEVADVKPEAFEVLKPALADSPHHRSLYIGTPKGLNHFHDFAIYGDHEGIVPRYEKPISPQKNWETFHFSSYDNMSWPIGSTEKQAFIEYIDAQKSELHEKGRIAFFNQEYMASFEETAGRFFPKWTYATHVIERSLDLQNSKYVIGSFDWGRTDPMAWYAHAIIPQQYNGVRFNRIITFREVYGPAESPYEKAEQICRQIDYKKVQKTYCDPSMEIKLFDGSTSIINQLEKAIKQLTGDQPVLMPAMNRRPSRWAAIDNWMRTAPDGLPYWMITTDCPNLIRTIPLMVPDEHRPEDIDTTLEDHAIDSASYGIQYITWIDARLGKIDHTPTQSPGVLKPILPLDESKFANIKFSKTNRDWRSI